MSRLTTSPLQFGAPQQGIKIRNGLHVGGLATSPLPSRGSRTWGQILKWPTHGRTGYITPAVSGGHQRMGNIRKGPHEGGLATSPLPSRGSSATGQNQKRPTHGRIGHITPAVPDVLVKQTKSEMAYMGGYWLHPPCRLESHPQGGELGSGPHVGGLATSPLPSRGSPSRGLNQMGSQVGGLATSPLPSGRSPTNGQNQKGTTRGRIGYITPAVCWFPPQGYKIRKGPHLGG